MKTALIFPGQGSQYVGMGKPLFDNFSEAKDVFQEVDDSLSQKLSQIIFDGPVADLNLTENTQPALMTVSMAVMRVLEKQGKFDLKKAASAVAGHSLGEYSALTAAGALTLTDTAKLLRIRGRAMQEAVPIGAGAMAAILGLDFEEVNRIAERVSGTDIVEAANDNANGQVVVSGHKAAVDSAVQEAREQGAKKAVELPVSAPFHCRLMQPAAERMADALGGTDIKAPAVPLYANVTAGPTKDPEEIRKNLVQQVTGTVRWRESVMAMRDNGIEEMIEIGAGKVLTGLVRRIDREIQILNLETPEQIEEFLGR